MGSPASVPVRSGCPCVGLFRRWLCILEFDISVRRCVLIYVFAWAVFAMCVRRALGTQAPPILRMIAAGGDASPWLLLGPVGAIRAGAACDLDFWAFWLLVA